MEKTSDIDIRRGQKEYPGLKFWIWWELSFFRVLMRKAERRLLSLPSFLSDCGVLVLSDSELPLFASDFCML